MTHNRRLLAHLRDALIALPEDSPEAHAIKLLDALRERGWHFVNGPRRSVDPEEGSPEYEAMKRGDLAAWGTIADPRNVTLRYEADVDNEVVNGQYQLTPHQLAAYGEDEGFKAYLERQLRHEFAEALLNRLVPMEAKA
jgi:hypothetical protein